MRPTQAGYALIVILLMAALVLITLSLGVQPMFTQVQREKEEELIFRGGQYRTAIARFYKKFGRFPTKIEELLSTNDRGFLRRPFPDPMTREGKWRLIRVGPGGEFIGSVQQPKVPGQPGGSKPAPGPGQAGAPPGTPARGMGDSSSYPLAGVASTSTERSFRVYEGFNQYYQWEFIYDPVKEALRNQPGVPGGAAPGTGKPPATSKPVSRP